MIVVLLYSLLESPTKNHTPSTTFCGDASSAEAPRTKQSNNTAIDNKTCHSNQRPTPLLLPAPKTQRPRVCAASVVSGDETLAIAAALRARLKLGSSVASSSSKSSPSSSTSSETCPTRGTATPASTRPPSVPI